MPGPPPKAASQRRRRNRASTAVVLVTPPKPVALPVDLPKYRPEVQAWLRDVATSPMAAEWDSSDVHGILLLADLHEMYWAGDLSPADKKSVAAEIRLQRAEFGLTPLSRRRLQWEIERAEDAVEKRAARKATPRARTDPRLTA